MTGPHTPRASRRPVPCDPAMGLVVSRCGAWWVAWIWRNQHNTGAAIRLMPSDRLPLDALTRARSKAVELRIPYANVRLERTLPGPSWATTEGISL